MSTISKEEMEKVKKIYEGIRELVSRIMYEEFKEVLINYHMNPEDAEKKIIPKDEKEEKVDIEREVTGILTNLGIPRNIKGFFFVRAAIYYCIEDESLLKAITKRLYPKVAREFETTSTRVERAIRHAIEICCEKGNLEYIQEVFGYTIDGLKGKPTNSQFIAMIVDEVKLHNL